MALKVFLLAALLLVAISFAPLFVRAQSSDDGPIPPPMEDTVERQIKETEHTEQTNAEDEEYIIPPRPCFWGGDSEEEEVPELSRSLQDAYLKRMEEDENHRRFSFMGSVKPYRWTKTATNPTGRTARGQPITVTWSIIPDGTPIAALLGGSESSASSNLQAFLRGIYGTDQAAINAFQGFFNEWASISGLTFVYEPKDDKAPLTKTSMPNGILGVRADMRIGGHRVDGNSGTLAYTYNPNWGDMVIDTGDSFYSTKKSLIRNVITHEIGHGIGFSHVCPTTKSKLMEPYVASTFLGLQEDEKRGVQFLYGDEYEENDSPSSAKSLGTLSSSLAVSTVSLERGSSDDDYYSFVVSSKKSVTVKVTPTGSNILTSNYGTSCPSTTVPALSQFNLNFQVIQASNSAVIATVAGTAVGIVESKTMTLTQGQTYYVRVYSPDAISSTTEFTDKKIQMYDLSLNAV